MSITLLLEKYDVSTEEGLQKALTEIEKEEAEVDEALSNALSRACTLEGRLRAASQAYSRLGEVRADTVSAADMVEKTAILAQDVSAKVRQLDLARTRVAECQRRVHDLIDLQLCSEGVEAAIKAQDYETGAAHVSRYRSMAPASLAAARARGAADPAAHMHAAAHHLYQLITKKFEEASRKEDEVAVERLYKLFPQIGHADDGLQLLGKHLAAQLEARVRKSCAVGGAAEGGAVFADAVTRALEAAAALVRRARPLCPDRMPALLAYIQPVVDGACARVVSAMTSQRRLGGEPQLAAPDALHELPLVHSTMQLYFNFLRKHAQGDPSGGGGDIEEVIRGSGLYRLAQDVVLQYAALERHYLHSSLAAALHTPTMVDDVFYLCRKVLRRSVSSCSVEAVCAALNEVCAALERDVAGALRSRLRAPPLHPLPLHHPTQQPATLAPQQDHQRDLYLAFANDAEQGAEWCARLAHETEEAAAALCGERGAREKLATCAGGLAAAAAALLHAHRLALDALRAALQPHAHAWADALAQPTPLDDDNMDDVEEDWCAEALPAALETLHEAARAKLSPRAASQLMATLLADLVARAEATILKHNYDRRGGIVVERRARRLASWAGGVGAGGALGRERCGALSRGAALLALDHPAAALQHQHPRARDILARRIDFKIEDIKRVKL